MKFKQRKRIIHMKVILTNVINANVTLLAHVFNQTIVIISEAKILRTGLDIDLKIPNCKADIGANFFILPLN